MVRYFTKKLSTKLFIFLYHDVTDNPSEFTRENELFVTPDTFRYQISIMEKHFNIIGPDDIYENVYHDRPSALITFDDVFRGAFNVAAPLLNKFGIPAVFFLNYGDMESGLFWSGLVCYLIKYEHEFITELQKRIKAKPSHLHLFVKPDFLEIYMARHTIDRQHARDFIGEFATVEDLRNCSESCRNIFYGNHLYRHYNALSLSKQELIDAYKENEQRLNKFSNYIPFFSFPFGQPGICYSKDSIETIKSCGANVIFSAFPAINRMSSKIMHRIPLTENHNTEKKILKEMCIAGLKPFVLKGLAYIRAKPSAYKLLV